MRVLHTFPLVLVASIVLSACGGDAGGLEEAPPRDQCIAEYAELPQHFREPLGEAMVAHDADRLRDLAEALCPEHPAAAACVEGIDGVGWRTEAGGNCWSRWR